MREYGGEGGNERGKTGGGSDGMHNLISHTGNLHTPEKQILLGNDQIYGKAAITAPLFDTRCWGIRGGGQLCRKP